MRASMMTRRRQGKLNCGAFRVTLKALVAQLFRNSVDQPGSGGASATEAAVVAKDPAKDPAPTVAGLPVTHVAGGALAAAGAALALKNIFDRPSRAYVSGPEDGGLGTVGEEYDAWTEEGILEYYWGEHIHLGWYSDEDMAKGAGTLLGSNAVGLSILVDNVLINGVATAAV